MKQMRNLMRAFAFFLTGFLLTLTLFLGFSRPAFAKGARVIDDADLLSKEEESELEEVVDKFRDKTGFDFVVLTIDDAEGKTTRDYADDYYDYGGYGTGKDYSGGILLLDMDNREINLVTTGEMIDMVSDADEEDVYDAGYDALVSGDYYTCLVNCVNQLIEISRGNYVSPLEGGLSAVAGVGAAAASRSRVKRQYKTKKQTVIFPYHDNCVLNLAQGGGSIDRFVDTIVTTRVIAAAASSGRTGGGHTSTHIGSSGRTHGGGHGRKF